MPPRRAVYTALLGRYEELNEQPTALNTDIPFICFTDDPNLVSETWQIHLVDPLFPSIWCAVSGISKFGATRRSLSSMRRSTLTIPCP